MRIHISDESEEVINLNSLDYFPKEGHEKNTKEEELIDGTNKQTYDSSNQCTTDDVRKNDGSGNVNDLENCDVLRDYDDEYLTYILSKGKKNPRQGNDDKKCEEKEIECDDCGSEKDKKLKRGKKNKNDETVEITKNDTKDIEYSNTYCIIEENPFTTTVEMAEYVFQYLDGDSLKGCTAVCRLWYYLLSVSDEIASMNTQFSKYVAIYSLEMLKKKHFELFGNSLYMHGPLKASSSIDVKEQLELSAIAAEEEFTKFTNNLTSDGSCLLPSYWFTKFEQDYGPNSLKQLFSGNLHKSRSIFRKELDNERNILVFLKKRYLRMQPKWKYLKDLFSKLLGKINNSKDIPKSIPESVYSRIQSCNHKTMSMSLKKKNGLYYLECTSCKLTVYSNRNSFSQRFLIHDIDKETNKKKLVLSGNL